MTAGLRPGAVLLVDGRASVQFAGDRALRLRVMAVDERPTYDGWVWLTGYVLNRGGDATGKRRVFVRREGLVVESLPVVRGRVPARVTVSAKP